MFFGSPFRPVRGASSVWLDGGALGLSVILFTFLTFYVMDATQLCTKFIDLLSQGQTRWPGMVTQALAVRRGMNQDYLPDLIDIQFIAARTKAIGRMIYYPFFVLVILIIARNHIFAAWNFPLSLVLIFGLNSAFAIFSAIHLRRAAEVSRHIALDRMKDKLSRALGANADEKTLEQIRQVIQEIKENEEGAFAPISKHPIIAAVIMPFGGAGILALLEYLANTP
jgi:hypothetical protein